MVPFIQGINSTWLLSSRYVPLLSWAWSLNRIVLTLQLWSYGSHFVSNECYILMYYSIPFSQWQNTWWRHQMEIFSALLAICAGNSSVPGEFPGQRPVTRSFGVFFDLRPNKRLSKQSWGWWFETPSRPLWMRNFSVSIKCRCRNLHSL